MPFVMPAKTGIQLLGPASRLRGNDGTLPTRR